MPQATTASIPSRRSLLGGSAALLAGAAITATQGAGPAVASPDAELLRLCAQFDALTRTITGSRNTIKDDDAREIFLAPILARQKQIKDVLWDQPPTTLEGLKALGRSIVLDSPDAKDDPDEILAGQVDGDLVCILLRALA